jgi:signal peptidase I
MRLGRLADAALSTAVFGAGAALLWGRRRFLLVTVVGQSMAPTYHDGQRLLLRRGRYAVGDVVMFAAPDRAGFDVDWLVKRAVALSGDPVPADVAALTGAGTVPRGRLVVRSDAAKGLDSRQLGFIDSRDVIGAVCWDGAWIPRRRKAKDNQNINSLT